MDCKFTFKMILKMIQSVSAQNMETLILYIYQSGQNAMRKKKKKEEEYFIIS